MYKLIIELKAINSYSYKFFLSKYPKTFNAFLYTHSRTLFNKHDENNYRFLCFSRLFKVENGIIISNKEYKIIIISIYKEIIEELESNLKTNLQVKLGEGLFEIISVKKKIRDKIQNFQTIYTSTPVIITKIKDEKIKSLTFENEKEEYLDLLKKNMIKKYNFYNNTDIPLDFNIFNNVEISSEGSFSSLTGFDKNFLIGSLLVFNFKNLSNITKRIFEFSFNVGFGEKNILGFGFPEIKNKYDYEEYILNESKN